MGRAILLLLLTGAGFAQQASIQGSVVDALTSPPLGGVYVTLIAVVMNGVTAPYGAMSHRTGHFSIATIRPGTYILFCDRSGYLQVQSKDSGIPNLSLKPSQQLRDYKIVLAPRAILAGR